MPLHFVLSQRGKPQLTSKGYLYSLLRENTGKVEWRCVEYTTQYKCKAIAHTSSTSKTGTILREDEHPTHAPDLGKLQSKELMNKAKKVAERTQARPSQIIQAVFRNASTSAVGELPGISSLTRTLTRTRAKANPLLITPATREELEITEIYTKTHGDENFLYYDHGKTKDRYLMFASERNIQSLSQCDIWMCDGTFLTVPKVFTQLYTIHGIFHGKPLPLIYVLAPNKTENTYKRILKKIRDSQGEKQPRKIISDFELGFLNAVEKVFSESNIQGCFFHFGQCIYRNVVKLGFAHQYAHDEAFNLHIRMMIALAFVPVGHVYEAFDTLLASEYFQQNKNDLQLIMKYYTDTWIGQAQKRGRRQSPQFAIDYWNCYDAVMDDTPRTNNSVEGWHNAFNSRIQSAHTSMGKFIDALKGEQSVTEAVMEQQNAGREIVPKKRRKYRDYDARLKNVVASFDEDTDVMEYLRGIAHNIKLSG